MDLDQIAALLIVAGLGDRTQIDKAAELSQGFGKFIRSLVGLERSAVADALSSFVSTGSATARQIEFVELVIEYVTEKGAPDPRLLYESPFSDLAPSGPEQVFPPSRVADLVRIVERLNESAVA